MPNPQQANRQETLARAIAEAFDDEGKLSLYATYCRKYPLPLIYRAFSEARSVPREKIRKSRAAIFFYLVKLYDNQTRHNSSR